MTTIHPKTKSTCVSCQIQDGLVTINGHGRGYYASRSGVRMLVVERGTNQYVRINDTIEVVVLEIGNGQVRFSIDQVAGSDRDNLLL